MWGKQCWGEGAGKGPRGWHWLGETRPSTAHPKARPWGQAIGLERVGGRQLELGGGGERIGEGSKGKACVAAAAARCGRLEGGDLTSHPEDAARDTSS